jgi:hypothetical protein
MPVVRINLLDLIDMEVARVERNSDRAPTISLTSPSAPGQLFSPVNEGAGGSLPGVLICQK